MKKTLLILLSFCLIFVLATPAFANNTKAKQFQFEDSVEPNEFDIQIIGENSCKGDYMGDMHFVLVRNNSDVTVEVNCETMAYDEDGELLEFQEGDEYIYLAPGETTVIAEQFETPLDEIASFETEVVYSVSEPSYTYYFDSPISYLSYEAKPSKKGVVLKINNSTDCSLSYHVYVLFFKNHELKGYDSDFVWSMDASDASYSNQFSARGDFDSFSVYFAGNAQIDTYNTEW